ncbi:hypothetical protein V2J09_005526 [Rumex salicifolius]
MTTIEENYVILLEAFLEGKIDVAVPEGENEEPMVTITNVVLEALAAVWSSSLVVKALGTMVPFKVMDRKLQELWKLRGRMRLVDLPNGYYLIKFDKEDNYIAVLTGGPWTVFGHYVVIKPWSPSFDPLTDVIATTPAWVRFSNLLVILYEEHIIFHIASTVGVLIKVDSQTLYANKGRFAKACIELNLSKPLKDSIIINGSRYLVEYEGLHAICFHCGRFEHFQPNCPTDLKTWPRRKRSGKMRKKEEWR